VDEDVEVIAEVPGGGGNDGSGVDRDLAVFPVCSPHVVLTDKFDRLGGNWRGRFPGLVNLAIAIQWWNRSRYQCLGL